MKNRKLSPFLDVKESAYLFEKVLCTSLQYPFETIQTHSTNGYSEQLYKLKDCLQKKEAHVLSPGDGGRQ